MTERRTTIVRSAETAQMDLLSAFEQQNAMATFLQQSMYCDCDREIWDSLLSHSATTGDMGIKINTLQAKNLNRLGKMSLWNVWGE